MNSKKIVFGSLISLLGVLPVSAQNSKEYAQLGKASWSAFECSVWAEKAGDTVEQQRLFLHGYEQGKKFIALIKENKINPNDLSSEVPIYMRLLLQGPSPDFMLGRIFEWTSESALKDVHTTNGNFNSDEEQKSIARNKFWRFNCQLIGKAP